MISISVGHCRRAGDDAVEREDEVEHQDLADGGGHRHAGDAGGPWAPARLSPATWFVDLGRGLPDQEQAAPPSGSGHATRSRGRTEAEHRLRELHDEGDAGQQPPAAGSRARPITETARPGNADCSASLLVRMEMKIRLSMPSTTFHDPPGFANGQPGGGIGEQNDDVFA